ncbi:MAG: ABC transporter permease [Defluviitaleaceae bacterium]|nr:ABC transporter permease [Defluviitaleaceae bacterium]
MKTSQKRALFSFIILMALFGVFSLLTPDLFLAPANLRNILQQLVIFVIIACGLTFPIVGGGNDLSVGASMALAGIVVVALLIAGTPLVIAIIISLVIGIATGILNGFFIEFLGVVPFIATLGTGWVFRGLANSMVRGMPLYSRDIENETTRQAFDIIGNGRFGNSGIFYSVIIAMVYAIILGIILAKTRIGRQIYACGSNLEAAKLSGISAKKTRMFAYAVSGFSAAICGVIMASRITSAQPNAMVGIELEAIAMAVVGGVSIWGGEGSILNTVIGALIIGVLRNGLNLNGVDSFRQQVIIGLILIFAVALQTARKKEIKLLRRKTS